MNGLEVIIVILGILFVIISILIVDSTNGKSEQTSAFGADGFELTEDEENIIKDKVSSIIDRETEIMLEDSDIKLSHISNEKILAVNEFSEQVIEKIENNHKDVIFLYDMLQKKQEELKELLRVAEEERTRHSADLIRETEKIETIIKELEVKQEELINRTEMMKKNETVKKTVSQTKTETIGKQPVRTNSKSVSQVNQKKANAAGNTVKKTEPASMIDIPEQGAVNNNEKILALYKQKKTVLEISKALGMGQGEVKLVIDLYGH